MADEATDDQLLGTEQPVKVGGTWPPNEQLLKKWYARSVQFPEQFLTVSGHMQLKELKTINNIDCLAVMQKTRVTAKCVAGQERGSLDIRSSSRGYYPIDPTKPAVLMVYIDQMRKRGSIRDETGVLQYSVNLEHYAREWDVHRPSTKDEIIAQKARK